MRSTEAFEAFYKGELKQSLQSLDQVRKTILTYGLSFVGVLLLSFLLAFVIIYFFQPGQSGMILIVVSLILIFIGGLIYVSSKTKELAYKKIFKSKIIHPIINFISEDLSYHPNQKINQNQYERSRLYLNNIDKYNGDDYVSGKIDQTVFEFSEIHTQYKSTSTDSKGNRRTKWVTVFKGLFFVADFNKDFEGSTVLLPNYWGKGFKFFKKLAGVSRIEKFVQLEDAEFSKNFNCYSTNDIKARYILSPALMQRITAFKEKYPKNPVAIAFVDGRIYVAITYSKDLFEPTYFKSLVSIELVKTYFEDVKFVVDLVEELNLNTRIWTKS
ncbi:MAG: DUF3137 domain-containing protein [Flavobacteriaceae bacterium]|nr:DUF3137 domain-containing protein [Flavobacteriaceae bacterium]